MADCIEELTTPEATQWPAMLAETTAGGATSKLREATAQSLEEKTNPSSKTRVDLLTPDEQQLRGVRVADRAAHRELQVRAQRDAQAAGELHATLRSELAVFGDAARLCEEGGLANIPQAFATLITNGQLDLTGSYAARTHAAVTNLPNMPNGWRWHDAASQAALEQMAFQATRQSGRSAHLVSRGDPKKRGRSEPLPSIRTYAPRFRTNCCTRLACPPLPPSIPSTLTTTNSQAGEGLRCCYEWQLGRLSPQGVRSVAVVRAGSLRQARGDRAECEERGDVRGLATQVRAPASVRPPPPPPLSTAAATAPQHRRRTAPQHRHRHVGGCLALAWPRSVHLR